MTDSLFNFGKIFTKNAITFDLTKIERTKINFVDMKFCCASNAALKNLKSQKKINISKNIFQQNRNFSKIYRLFSDSGGSSRHFEYRFICLGLIMKLRINYFHRIVKFAKISKNHFNFKF